MKDSKNISSIAIVNIVIVLFVAMNLSGLVSIYNRYTKIVNNNMQAIENVKDINLYLQSIDNNILYSINKIADNRTASVTEYTQNIDMYMGKCTDTIAEYQQIDITTLEAQRFNLFSVYFQSYEKKVNSILSTITSKDAESAQAIYTQELLPVRNCIMELLDALNDLSDSSSTQRLNVVNHYCKLMGLITLIVGIVLMVVVNVLNKRQKLATAKLIQSNETIMKQKGTIKSTTYKDIITDAYNRNSFLSDFTDGKKTLSTTESGYFIMFNLDGFHRINFNYGNNVGDLILGETVDRISNVFNGNSIYRTGSDEFVVLVKTQSTPESYNQVIALVNNAKMALTKPYQVGQGVVNLSCSISCVYVNGACTLGTDLLETASEAIKQGRMSGYGNTTFINTENNQSYLLNV
jgi:diguanylate cyclase (GGDEF)-like protein